MKRSVAKDINAILSGIFSFRSHEKRSTDNSHQSATVENSRCPGRRRSAVQERFTVSRLTYIRAVFFPTVLTLNPVTCMPVSCCCHFLSLDRLGDIRLKSDGVTIAVAFTVV